MTVLKFIVVLGLLQGSWLGMALVMRSGSPTLKRVAILALFFAAFLGVIMLGAYHSDFSCHPGQRCFPWGY